jgi:uncharacterized protein YneF (UPF0154 family)
MQVWVVVLQRDKGVVAGVFSTMKKAADYIADNPYNGYAMYERTVDKGE